MCCLCCIHVVFNRVERHCLALRGSSTRLKITWVEQRQHHRAQESARQRMLSLLLRRGSTHNKISWVQQRQHHRGHESATERMLSLALRRGETHVEHYRAQKRELQWRSRRSKRDIPNVFHSALSNILTSESRLYILRAICHTFSVCLSRSAGSVIESISLAPHSVTHHLKSRLNILSLALFRALWCCLFCTHGIFNRAEPSLNPVRHEPVWRQYGAIACRSAGSAGMGK